MPKKYAKQEKKLEITINGIVYKAPKTVANFLEKMNRERWFFKEKLQKILVAAQVVEESIREELVKMEEEKISEDKQYERIVPMIEKTIIGGAGAFKELMEIGNICKETYPERMKEFAEKKYSIIQGVRDILENRHKLVMPELKEVDIKDKSE